MRSVSFPHHFLKRWLPGLLPLLATCLLAVALPAPAAQARESFTSAPSAQLVVDFFNTLTKIIFLSSFPDSNHLTGPAAATASAPAALSPAVPANSQAAAIRIVLAGSIDAAGIGRFIL